MPEEPLTLKQTRDSAAIVGYLIVRRSRVEFPENVSRTLGRPVEFRI